MVNIPDIFYDKKYEKWIIDDDPYEMFVLKPNAPRELQEALRKFKLAVSRDNLVVDRRKERDNWEEIQDCMDE